MSDIDPNRIGIIGGSYDKDGLEYACCSTPQEFAVGVDIFGVSNCQCTLESIPPYWEAQRLGNIDEIKDPSRKSANAAGDLARLPCRQDRPGPVLQGRTTAIKPRVRRHCRSREEKNAVPVEYLVFADEGHGFTKKKNQIEGYSAVLEIPRQALERV